MPLRFFDRPLNNRFRDIVCFGALKHEFQVLVQFGIGLSLLCRRKRLLSGRSKKRRAALRKITTSCAVKASVRTKLEFQVLVQFGVGLSLLCRHIDFAAELGVDSARIRILGRFLLFYIVPFTGRRKTAENSHLKTDFQKNVVNSMHQFDEIARPCGIIAIIPQGRAISSN